MIHIRAALESDFLLHMLSVSMLPFASYAWLTFMQRGVYM